MFNIGPTELLVILLIALIVFGPKRLPEVGRTVGKSLREFRKATTDIKNELNLGLDDDDDDVGSGGGASAGAAPVAAAQATDQPSPNGHVADAEGSEAAGTGPAI